MATQTERSVIGKAYVGSDDRVYIEDGVTPPEARRLALALRRYADKNDPPEGGDPYDVLVDELLEWSAGGRPPQGAAYAGVARDNDRKLLAAVRAFRALGETTFD